jgi:hypothetical protein
MNQEVISGFVFIDAARACPKEIHPSPQGTWL